MKRLTVVMAAAMVLGAPAVAWAEGGQGKSKHERAQGGAAQAGQDPTLSKLVGERPKDFAEMLHQTNMMEVRLGQLAQERAQSDSVKEFGRMMVQEHQQMDRELMQMAKQQKWTLREKHQPKHELGRTLQRANEAAEAKLSRLEGPAFDSAFMAHMVGGHDLTILMTAQAAKTFEGTELANQLTTSVLPKLQQHRQRAYEILDEVKPDPQQMGVGGAGESGMPMEHDMGMENEPGMQPEPR